MPIEIVKALLLLARYCQQQIDCKKCPLHDFCGKVLTEW